MRDAAIEMTATPPAATGPQAWYAKDMTARIGEWRYVWTAAEVAEIEAAVQSVMDRDLDLLQIGAAEFPL